MKILGIETSCDETAAAVVADGKTVLSNVIATSAQMHIATGGIIPETAARQQVKFIIPVISKALKEAKLTYKDIDAIAVTYGPGLIGSLLVGVETAKTLAYIWQKPVIPVNHLIGHIYANWVNNMYLPKFPAIALVVSGGHTDLVLMQSHKDLKWIGGTRDDASGEAFDKCARLLDLPYPGGPNISAAAETYLKHNTKNLKLEMFPRPMIYEDNFDWSFSGLKTAALRETKNLTPNTKDRERLAAEVQEAIVDVLVNKTIKAVKIYKPKSLLLSGGVSANNRLRERFESSVLSLKFSVKLFLPEKSLCTDNAVMTAVAAYYRKRNIAWKDIATAPELTITG